MPVYKDEDIDTTEELVRVAKLCALAAKRAPKVADTEIKTTIVTGEDIKPILELLEILGEGSAFIRGDAAVVRKLMESGKPPVLLLVGVDASVPVGWNCGACGFPTCGEFNKFCRENKSLGYFAMGPSCAWKIVDHGLALSYAAATCAMHNVENRIQTSVGASASLLGFMENCTFAVAITMGPAGEEYYFNRTLTRDIYTEEEVLDMLMRNFPTSFDDFAGSGWPRIKHIPTWMEDVKFSVVTKVPEVEEKLKEVRQKATQYVIEYFSKKYQQQ